MANIAAGLSGTFVVNGSPTKTQMVDSAGGRSQVAQVTTALIVLIVLLFLTAPIQYMPQAVLSSVVFLIGVELVDLIGMRRVLRARRDEFIVATLTALTVVLIGVEQGIVLAIVASIIDHLRRSYRPPAAVIEPAEGAGPSPHWHSVPARPDARSLPGLVIYRFAASLYYANADHFATDVLGFLDEETTPPVEWLCIDGSAMPDIDYSGGQVLQQLHGELSARHVRLVLCEVMTAVRDELDRYGLTEMIGTDALYADAVSVAQAFEQRAGA